MRWEAGIGAAPEAYGLVSLEHAADVRDPASARQEAGMGSPDPSSDCHPDAGTQTNKY